MHLVRFPHPIEKLCKIFILQVFKTAKALQHERNQTRHLLNQFNFVSEILPDAIESNIEDMKLHMIHNPIDIQICGMFHLNYFILYAVRLLLRNVSFLNYFHNPISGDVSQCRILDYACAVPNGWIKEKSCSGAFKLLVKEVWVGDGWKIVMKICNSSKCCCSLKMCLQNFMICRFSNLSSA